MLKLVPPDAAVASLSQLVAQVAPCWLEVPADGAGKKVRLELR